MFKFRIQEHYLFKPVLTAMNLMTLNSNLTQAYLPHPIFYTFIATKPEIQIGANMKHNGPRP